MAHQHKKAI